MTVISPTGRSRIYARHTPAEPNNLPHVAIVMGGLSAERDVSLSSGKGIFESFKRMDYPTTAIDMDRDLAHVLNEVKPDIVFNALHGPYGEDGCVPGLLEVMGIPYTHSGVLASAVALDKEHARSFFLSQGILMPKGRVLHRSENLKKDPMPRPYVIKPIHEGSSIGVHVIFEQDNFSLAEYDWAYGDSVIVEQYIPGKEIQVAVVDGEALGAIELRPKGRFYDYEAKYTEGRTEHIMPAPISKKAYQEVLEMAATIHRTLGCRSVSRVDFRYWDTPEGDGKFYLLEVNTHPGMTPLSLVPEIAAYKGISFDELMIRILKGARCEK